MKQGTKKTRVFKVEIQVTYFFLKKILVIMEIQMKIILSISFYLSQSGQKENVCVCVCVNVFVFVNVSVHFNMGSKIF